MRYFIKFSMIFVLLSSVFLQCEQNTDQTEKTPTTKKCNMCSRPIQERTACIISKKDTKQFNACCAHCGIMLMMKLGEVEQGLTKCYETGKEVMMEEAVYVFESDEIPCCSPSIIAFSSFQEAESFSKIKHGDVLSLHDILQNMKENKHDKS